MTGKIKQRFWNIASSGLPVDHDLEALRKIFLLNLIIIFGCIFLLLLGIIAFIQRDNLLGVVDLLILSFLISLFFYLRVSKNHRLASVIGTIVTGVLYSFLIAYGGINNTAYVWAFTYPLISLFLLGIRLGSFFSLLLFGIAGAVFAFGTKFTFFSSYSIDLIVRFIPAYVTIHLFALVMEKTREMVQTRLKTSNIKLEQSVEGLEKTNKEKQSLIHELQDTMNEVKNLQGILPICASCKKN